MRPLELPGSAEISPCGLPRPIGERWPSSTRRGSERGILSTAINQEVRSKKIVITSEARRSRVARHQLPFGSLTGCRIKSGMTAGDELRRLITLLRRTQRGTITVISEPPYLCTLSWARRVIVSTSTGIETVRLRVNGCSFTCG